MTTQRKRVAFGILLVGGVLARVAASGWIAGYFHPDEHQQYLEVANGIVYGQHVKFWEEDAGIRHALFPGVLAGALWGLDALGVDSPWAQAVLLRLAISLGVFAGLALLARGRIAEGRPEVGWLLLGLAAFSPDLIAASQRTLSESGAMVLLAFALACWSRRPGVAGLLLGLMVGVRLQTAVLIPPLWALAVVGDLRAGGPLPWWRRPWARLSIGLAAGLLVVGLIDRLTLGGWFRSAFRSVTVQVVEGKAAEFGVDPWTRYLHVYTRSLIGMSPFVPILAILGLARVPGPGLALLGFAVAHSLIEHKEDRFLWPAYPILLLLVAEGFGLAYRALRPPWRTIFVGLVLLSLAAGVPFRAVRNSWWHEPSRSGEGALMLVGARADLTGLALIGLGEASTGNYFYLRRDVPLLLLPLKDPTIIWDDPDWQHPEIDASLRALWPDRLDDVPRINYVISYKEPPGTLAGMGLEEIARVGVLTVYRRPDNRPSAPAVVP